MKSYYADNLVTLYHGDCRELLPSLQGVDLVLTDPPYGIGLKANYRQTRDASQLRDTRRHAWMSRSHNLIQGDSEPFNPSHLLSFRYIVLWGANAYSSLLPSSYSWFVWDKKDGRGASNGFSDAEMAWVRGDFNSVRIFHHLWTGYQRDSEVGERVLHPTQKPIALMRWCISYFPLARIILDPYVGSGATLRAAKELGRHAIGIEIEEKYCEIAARRLEVTQPALFTAPTKQRQEQASCFQ